MKINLKHIIVFVLLLSVYAVNSQPLQIKFEHLSIEKGLSQSSVSSITQDEKGFLWFGTLDGLNRYDGYNFKKYYSNSDSTSIPSNIITSIINDKNKTIWVATDNGICKYNKLKDNFIRIIDNKTKIHEKRIIDIKDEGDIIWIATEYQFFKLNKLNNKITELKLPDDFNKDKITGISQYKDYLWLVSENKIYRLNQVDNSFLIIDLKKDNRNLKKPQALFITKDETVLFGTNEFLAELIYQKSGFYKVKVLIEDINVSSISEDEHGIIWVGTKIRDW